MNTKLMLLVAGSTLTLHAHADWFVRGTHNNWAADMEMQSIGNNTVIADDVVFSSDGLLKFDRFGDWTENYGVGGQNGGDIAVSAGTWDIEFYTDSKNWKILPPNTHGPAPATQYHFRGTSNGWVEGTIMTAVAGQANQVETCQDFTGNTNPRFKIDPNGGWNGDEFPADDVTVSGSWTRIVVNTSNDSIVSVEENLGTDCGTSDPDSDQDGVPDSIDQCPNTPAGALVDANGCEIVVQDEYHVRGTHNGWATGTIMTPVAGSSDYEICINFASGDANGGPRFKIDPDGGDWGGNEFPAEDVSVSTGFAHIVVDSTNDSIKSVTSGLGANCEGPDPIADDFRSRTMYFLFVDRFANGDPSNDNGNNPAGTSTIGGAGGLGEWKKYWGGDIQGIIDNLDYLENLGVSAIWVTPLNDNIDATGNEGAYHGYWGRDFYEVDEHVGTWDLVDTLDAEMEARGMKLVLDIALNHTNQDDAFEFGAVLKEGVFLADASNGEWFHQNGAIADCGDNDPSTVCNGEWDDPWSFRNKTLFNLTDFNHGVNSNSVADTYLIEAALKWMEHGVDAFRIDAIKHIEPNFINRFSQAVRAQDPDIYIFGEWYGAGASDSLSMQFLNENRGSELLDFNLRDNIENAIAGDITMEALSAHIESRAGAMNNREDWQPIFLDNHDATRTSVYLQTTGLVNSDRQGKGFGKALSDARQNLGMALVMTLPGIPTIYYGSEQNSTWFTANGDGQVGHDPYNRESMPSFSQNTAAFQMISALAQLRKDSPAIATGTYTQKWMDADVLVFERNEGDDAAVIAVNRGGARTINVSALGLADGTYTNLVGGGSVTVSGGQATLSLGENGVIVLR